MPIARSLRARVLIWVGAALTALFGVTIVALDLVLHDTIDRSRRELLENQLFGLIAVAEFDDAGHLFVPEDALNEQYRLADSGTYGVLWNGDGKLVWQSSSLAGAPFPKIDLPEPGQRVYVTVEPPDLPPLEVLAMGTRWGGDDAIYTFGAAVSLVPYQEQLVSFRRNLVSWFSLITLIMLVVITAVLGWVMRPLRRLERQVADVEKGTRAGLEGEYPTELEGLASNLNVLIETERRRLSRYRHMLDDLAHSLKTPLAAMRALLSESPGSAPARAELDRELDRMDQRISYQLRRARASGATGIGTEPIELAPIVADLRLTLDKVYRDKQVSCAIEVPGETCFHGDRGDLTELLGNLLENAYKYCRARVRISAHAEEERVVIVVEDDGPGMDADDLGALLERGKRADETLPGQGIGLAVVHETVELYSGRVHVAQSPLGGAAVTVELGRAGAA